MKNINKSFMPMDAGRPTKDSPSLRERLLASLKVGCTIEEICDKHGVSPRGLYDWRQKDQDFDTEVKESIQYYKNKTLTNRRRLAETVITGTLEEEDARLRFDAAKYVLDRCEDWVKPATPIKIGGIEGQPIETKDVTLSANDAARRVALMLAKGLMGADKE